MKPRYLTKSRFKLAVECPTKLYYEGKIEYANQKIDDPFLLALADGGFQVGELAKCYFSGGCDIESKDYGVSLEQTNELLEKDQAIIYEAAVQFENLFIRADILLKDKGHLRLIEVKSKSFNGTGEEDFLTRRGTIISDWQPYLLDVAFQKFVVQSAFPNYTVSAYLMLTDKNALCPTNGLNQKFRIVRDQEGRKKVVVSGKLSEEDLSVPILKTVQVDKCCHLIHSQAFGEDSFTDYVKRLADHYSRDKKIVVMPSVVCGKCEFKATDQERAEGLKSGFHECWMETLKWTEEDFKDLTIFDIWTFRKKEQLMQEGRIKVKHILEEDISPRHDLKPGISLSQRQWLQIQKIKNNDESFWIDKEALVREMEKWVYPLHFIDFETAMVAIPFNKGRRPYEGIAFQFSHHVVCEDGRIEHRGQYLNTKPGEFPNYDFIRHLKKELEEDQGTIFRYATHENSYLNLIYCQLREDSRDISDREELCQFIRSITKPGQNMKEKWEGSRVMVDMLELVKRFYYDPAMKGSNSIKHALPAILNSSKVLQDKYIQPIYGADGGMPSLNYKDWAWIKFNNDCVIDPYQLLPKMFEDISEKDHNLLCDDEIKDGGAAMTAYARMQFEDMLDYERLELERALLKYCELDTFAMVLIYEGWKEMINLTALST